MKNIIFGPINSRRFGISLGIDLSPNKKQCNFDCLYCELDANKVVDSFDEVLGVDEIIETLQNRLSGNIDFITITANGEPTLYPYLDTLIDEIDKIKGNTKTLILSNASKISDINVANALSKIDVVKLSLDCIDSRCLKKLDRAQKSINIEDIKQGMLNFAKIYKKDLIIEILFVKTMNDKDIDKYSKFLLELNPKRIDIGTIDRPPAYDVKPLSYEELLEISHKFDSNLPIYISSRKNISSKPTGYSDDEILATLAKRPLSDDDIEILFDNDSQKRLKTLLKAQKIEKIELNQIFFYKLTKKT